MRTYIPIPSPPFGSVMPGREYSNGAYRFGFNGKEKDGESSIGNYDFTARLYNSRLGRWCSPEPLFNNSKLLQSFSRYLYSYNSPLIFTDPTGEIPIPQIIGAGKVTITSRFGQRKGPFSGKSEFHNGIDLVSTVPGPPIRSWASGTVVAVGYDNINGYYVKIDHGNGYISMYDHMQANSATVNVGDKVTNGEQIGKVGQSGSATGPHLHLMLFKNGLAINPESIGDLHLKLHPINNKANEIKTLRSQIRLRENMIQTYKLLIKLNEKISDDKSKENIKKCLDSISKLEKENEIDKIKIGKLENDKK